jgi:hypothetical protein
MQYHCLIYFDPKAAFADTAEAKAVLNDIGPHTEALKASGHLVSHFPLNLPSEAVTVSARDGRVSSTDGPFMETREMLGGLVVIEARDLNEAIRIAGEMPHARLGHVEIRPAIDFTKPRPKF